ncbi:RDD domain containing protein [Parvibaculum lavamentivorans DS-1]|uniref:RDD domain containing protein n=2 Tax=Parvibaculum lavamentivorans TaxID=256618 RepID=A7HX59_PARL1|nr:RDD domain containing protein [Parvibaculum lavamentivorans DS-1]
MTSYVKRAGFHRDGKNMSESNQVAPTGLSASESFQWPAGSFDGVIAARCLAFLADLLAVCILLVLATIAFGVLGILTFGLLWPGAALSPLIALAYFTFTLGGRHSATPGMRWQGIELRAWNGRRPGYLQAALQTILFYASVAIGTVLVLLVPFFNEQRRCLHDYLCGTVFVRRSV